MEHIAYEGPKFTIEWYYDEEGDSQALDFLEGLNEKEQDRLFYLLKRMGNLGAISDKTKFRNEGDKIYAFKPKPERFLCFFQKGKKIIITNAFTKRRDKLPKTEKDRALSCMKDYLKRTKTGDYYAD